MEALLFRFPMVSDKMAAILFKTEHHRITECHWKTEQRATIGILKAFVITGATVLMFFNMLDSDPNRGHQKVTSVKNFIECDPGLLRVPDLHHRLLCDHCRFSKHGHVHEPGRLHDQTDG